MIRYRCSLRVASFGLVSLLAGRTVWGQDSVPADPRFRGTAQATTEFIRHEMAAKNIPGISIALVEGDRTVWAGGFGVARIADSTPATAETIYRVGSVTKLFTALSVMQLVEERKLELDAPVTRYLPGFAPRNPWNSPISLRQLLSHRSGLVREPPVGNYFSPAPATLEATVESLNRTSLVFQPEKTSTTKYSNAGVAVAGRVVEAVARMPYERVISDRLLGPMGMSHSSFDPARDRRHLAAGTMWTVDGRRDSAPTFVLGMTPAANLYSTANDLARFMSVLFMGGKAGNASVVSQASLDQMEADQRGNQGFYGLGFNVSQFDGTRHIGHGGAIYGFSTEFHALPDEKIGVVILANLELSNSVIERIGAFALRSMRAEKAGSTLPQPVMTQPVAPDFARQISGHFFNARRRFELRERQGGLLLIPAGGIPVTLRSSGANLVVDDIREFGNSFTPLSPTSIAWGEQLFVKDPAPMPDPPPERWRGLIGEYGWSHNTLYLYEDLGRLRALIEWFFAYPLDEVSDSTFTFPQRGLYAGETLVVHRDEAGKGISVDLNGIVFPRRAVGPSDGGQLKIRPVRPVAQLLVEARAATPPSQAAGLKAADLVDLATLDSTIRFDVRYATTNNFVGTVFYSQARAFLQRPAAMGLLEAHRWLREKGYGLLIHDAYRPWYVTKVFWDATPDSLHWLVANPANGSRHNRGAAVDLTLYDLKSGQPIEMVGTYDEATARSLSDYPGGTALQRWHRELLRAAMERNGFTVYAEEWWHFDFDGWREYPILNQTFEELTGGG
jgi:CubicO group peptidase (beta-lactamase class C family)/D-alanyl-D-alanine dipeptidase